MCGVCVCEGGKRLVQRLELGLLRNSGGQGRWPGCPSRANKAGFQGRLSLLSVRTIWVGG